VTSRAGVPAARNYVGERVHTVASDFGFAVAFGTEELNHVVREYLDIGVGAVWSVSQNVVMGSSFTSNAYIVSTLERIQRLNVSLSSAGSSMIARSVFSSCYGTKVGKLWVGEWQ
jgi:hypothetical protein